jgi:ferrous iron transport protein A
MIPITMMNPGDTVRIKKITGSDKVRQHLSELGCVVDGEITIISRMGGNVIIQVKDSRVALDRSMANRILV